MVREGQYATEGYQRNELIHATLTQAVDKAHGQEERYRVRLWQTAEDIARCRDLAEVTESAWMMADTFNGMNRLITADNGLSFRREVADIVRGYDDGPSDRSLAALMAGELAAGQRRLSDQS